MELISGIIETTINSFDFALVISINIASYIIINIINDIKHTNISKWSKRLVTAICTIVLAVTYHFLGACEDYLILNSAILAPVFWSWLGKPILRRLKLDYRNDEIMIDDKGTDSHKHGHVEDDFNCDTDEET